MRISSSALEKFAYCPRWYKIHYILGFCPKTPIKAKFAIGDALHKCMVSKSKDDFLPRIEGLLSGENVAEEDLPFQEAVERGKILLDEALKWLAGFKPIWQERLVEVTMDGITLFGYPDLLGERQGENILVDYKVSTKEHNTTDGIGELIPLTIYKLGLQVLGHKVDKQMLASMIFRTRKERYSNRTKTPLVEINEVPVEVGPGVEELVIQTIKDIVANIQAERFPALGMRNGVCSWCPNAQRLKDRTFCLYPDDILRQFSKTSLQRCGLEKWREEF